jgi:predicted dehydrogenase
MNRCRWAIVGTGDVSAKFVIGLRSVPGAEAAIIASRSLERATSFAGRLGIGRAVGSYEEAAAADFDAAYIATPPSEHRDHALLFIRAGKAVLIEKPFATAVADADAIIDAARAANVFCMEGMWTWFLPAIRRARSLVAEGCIGTPRSLFASFANMTIVDPKNSLFRADLGGGVLSHRGVYPIALAVDLLGPASVISAAMTRGETGVDEEITALLRHDCGAVSTIYSGARTTADNSLVILGTGGTLRLVGPIYRPFGVEIQPANPSGRGRGELTASRMAILKEGPMVQGLRQRLDWFIRLTKNKRYVSAPYIGNGYAHEAMAVMESLGEGVIEHRLGKLRKSRMIVALMEKIRAKSVTI